jgi:hypothetical protein
MGFPQNQQQYSTEANQGNKEFSPGFLRLLLFKINSGFRVEGTARQEPRPTFVFSAFFAVKSAVIRVHPWLKRVRVV